MGGKRFQRNSNLSASQGLFQLLAWFLLFSIAAIGSLIINWHTTSRSTTATQLPVRLSSSSSSEDTSQLQLYTILTSRVCGSPATDSYTKVDPTCLKNSPTAQWWFSSSSQNPDYFSTQHLNAIIEHSADYDGVAVRWGIGFTKSSVEECAEACQSHTPYSIPGPMEALPCNAFSFCASDICFEPDLHTHTRGDCWLKFTEGPANPEVNMRGRLVDDNDGDGIKKRHPSAPDMTPWHSGVLLPVGMDMTNGTWSPRHDW